MSPAEFLCKSCGNKDIRYISHGHHNYRPEMACDYDMALFPRARECHKYEPLRLDEDEIEVVRRFG